MNCKRRYKICTRSVILEELESRGGGGGGGGGGIFRNYKGFSMIVLSQNFRHILKYYESENFSDSSLHHIFESENFRFSFFFEK